MNKKNITKDKKVIEKNKKAQRKKKKHPILRTILILLLIGAISYAGYFAYKMNQNGWTSAGFAATILGHDSSTLDKIGTLQVLVVGKSQNLTDTIIICSYNPKKQEASMISIPRDTFTGTNKNTATAYQKINTLYGRSPEKLLEEVNELTGFNLQYYMCVDTKALIELVDTIGGVNFDVPIKMKYDDAQQNLHINLNSGYQLLDGKKAEQLVRFRHNNNGSTYPSEYGQEDIGRMRTQREFLKAVAKKVLVWENVGKIDDFISIANKNVETNMNFSDYKDFMPYAIEFNLDNLRTETLPGVPEKCNEVWLYICNKTKTKELINEIFNGDDLSSNTENKTVTVATETSKLQVEILNGSSNEKNIEKLKTELSKNGYSVVSTGKTNVTSRTTIINRTSQESEEISKIKGVIGKGVELTGQNSKGIDFTIIIGNDF